MTTRHPSQRRQCHVGQNFPPFEVTGLDESAREDTSPATVDFVVDEEPPQPSN